ncbi:TnsA endonuclease N-terminal domain-containing protein [Stenotrophomonas sp. S39]|nr:TnsA endonuclease N-terminal domain-containing protein [Stenotrophomonas sp. S39]
MKNSHRALTGKVNLEAGGVAGFESSLERDLLLILDFDRTVLSVKEQPFSLTHIQDASVRRYTPDVMAEYDRDVLPTVVFEVKPIEKLRADWASLRPAFKAAVAHCRLRDWQFKIVTERHIRTPYLANAKFLRRYRDLPPLLVRQAQLRYTATALGPTTPQGLLAAAYWPKEEQAQAIPALWQMVATGQFNIDLTKPLSMRTPMHLVE